jgi:hypothetical protein
MLLSLITVGGVLLGGRIEYLRRCAAFHEQLAKTYARAIEADGHQAGLQFMLSVHNVRESDGPTSGCFVNDDHRMYVGHQDLAYEYRRATYRPWMIVDDTLSIEDSH